MSKFNSRIKHLRAKLNKRSYSILIGFALVLILAFGIWLKSSRSPNVSTDYCAAKKTLTYSCYKDELANIVKRDGPEPATALVEKQYPKVQFVKVECHQLMHVIGRTALDKYNDLGQTYAHGNHFCASGYFHGAAEEIVKTKGTDYMLKNASQICGVFAKKQPYSLNHYNCVHGLGHGLMESTDSELFQSLHGCDALNNAWEQQSCDSGVFMQNIMITQIQSDESDNHSSKYLKKDDLMYPCNAVAQKYKWGCYIIQTSWALPQTGDNYAKVFSLCKSTPEATMRYVCYQSLGRDNSGFHLYDINETRDTCMIAPDQDGQSNCAIGAAKDFVYHYHSDVKAKEFCNSFDQAIQTICNSTVVSFYKTFK